MRMRRDLGRTSPPPRGDTSRKQEAKSGLFDLATRDDSRKQKASEDGMKGGEDRRKAAEAAWKQPARQAYDKCLQDPTKGRPSADAWARANARLFGVRPDTLAKALREKP